jgi:hypothetical protein
MVEVFKLSDEEQIEIFVELTRDELIKELLECNKIIRSLKKRRVTNVKKISKLLVKISKLSRLEKFLFFLSLFAIILCTIVLICSIILGRTAPAILNGLALIININNILHCLDMPFLNYSKIWNWIKNHVDCKWYSGEAPALLTISALEKVGDDFFCFFSIKILKFIFSIHKNS